MNIVDLYIRVSTTEQAEEGYSVGEQENKLRAYCEAYNYSINRVCVDPGVSGATMDRPGLHQLIYDVENHKCNRVLVWKLDRLSRSQKDTLILLEDVFLANGCDFVSLMESFDTSTAFGRCIIGILAAFAQMERENIKARTMMGRTAKIHKGHFSGSHCPIGYKFKEGCNDLIIDPYYSKIIKDAFNIYLSGKGISETGRIILNKYGNTDFDWSNNTSIRRLLSNPVYMGKVRLKNEVFDGIHEPIVSAADWYKVAALLDHNKAIDKRAYRYLTGNPGYSDNLLTGLLFCGDCGARMYARKVSKKTRKYICHSVARTSAPMIKSDHCTNRLHPYTVAQLDELIINEINKLSLDRSEFNSVVETNRKFEHISELPALRDRLAEIDKQNERILNLYQSGIVELSEIIERLGKLKDEKEKLQQSIYEYETAEANNESIEEAWNMLKSFAAIREANDHDALHKLIHSLIDRIEVLNEDVTIYWSFC